MVLSKPSQVLLTAIVIVADWIASNTDFFPLYPISEVNRPPVLPDAVLTERRVKEAWRRLGLPPRWSAMPLGADLDAVFGARFGQLGAVARPVQRAAVEMADAQPQAGLVIVEAPMGAGKTEAALLAAEVLAHRSRADGCFVALPTQATSDAMFGRVLQWLKALPGDSALSVNLVHGKASLNDDYAGLVRESRYANIGDGQPDAVMVHQWMRGRKRAVLASFVVGTIDQVLFAGLKSRHLMLRHLALAGKVVIIDEVHAYDVYMSRYLDRVLHWLGAYGVPVVLLSATLPPARRTELLNAYESGTGREVPTVEEHVGYPVVTASGVRSPAVLPLPERRTAVAVERLDDELDTLVGFLRRHLTDGGCAVVVRNTVTRVQETADRLREVFGAEHITVNHSRFLSCDRARTDRSLLRRFGPPGPDTVRPGLHIVVASQVVEQSLDVDFDLMVTDLAPMDLVLQRLGRVHRHERDRPAGVRQARCALMGVDDWAGVPARAVRGSRRVYGEHPLLRSAALLADRESIRLPEDIAPLVASAYSDDPLGPPDWQPAMTAACRAAAERAERRRARAAESLLGETVPATTLVGWLYAGVGDVDGIDDSPRGLAQVRDGEESVEVLVVQRDESGGLLTPTWIERGARQQIPTDFPVPQGLARVIASCTLRLPLAMSHPGVIDDVITALERNTFTSFDQVPLLKGQLVLVLDSTDKPWCPTGKPVSGCPTTWIEGCCMNVDEASFNLVDQPWIMVRRADGTVLDLSLREVFAQAGDVAEVVGEVPTQVFALIRLLLAILHRAVAGPVDLDAWERLWLADGLPVAQVEAYLERYRDRFDLLHPVTPFLQVAGLHTDKGEVSELDKLVADVPNGHPFFTTRLGGVGSLPFAEAARWLVHCQAFDPSGIKSGAAGDKRVKGGKGYPIGTGWCGYLGGVLPEGTTLRDTLLLNLIATGYEPIAGRWDEDAPVWERGAVGPDETRAARPEPLGPTDLYTWQSRRIRLHHDGRRVTAVLICNGERITPQNRHQLEPHSAWRRSQTQEKKLGQATVYMPREHSPERAIWRGLQAILPAAQQTGGGKDPAAGLAPLVLSWISHVSIEEVIGADYPLRMRTIGMVYGSQSATTADIIDDALALRSQLVRQDAGDLVEVVVSCVAAAEGAARALGSLALHIAQAGGARPGPAEDGPRSRAVELAFAELDGLFRRWLAGLGPETDPVEAKIAWQRTARQAVQALSGDLHSRASATAWVGRTVNGRLVTSTLAHEWFQRDLRRVLPLAFDQLAVAESSCVRKGPVVPEQNQPSVRWAALDVTGTVVHQRLTQLQEGVLRDQSASVAALARLRRGVGKPPVQWLTFWRTRCTPDLAEPGAGDEPTARETAAHISMTLYAVHQQSQRGRRMYERGYGLGGSVRQLHGASKVGEPGSPPDPILRRFQTLGTADSLDELVHHLRGMVQLLRGEQIPLDYALLADQVVRWQRPGGPERVRLVWGRGFYRRTPIDSVGADPTDEAEPDHGADTPVQLS